MLTVIHAQERGAPIGRERIDWKLITDNVSFLIYPYAIPKEPNPDKPEREFHVGDKVKVNLHTGKIEEATVKAVIENEKGLHLQVDFGHEQTALIKASQVLSAE